MLQRDVQEAISNGEGQRIEFKEGFGETNKAIVSLCAFANSEGGAVYFGIKNDGHVVGVTIGGTTLERFGNKLTKFSSVGIALFKRR